MRRAKIVGLALATVFLLSGCFGDTETYQANEGKPGTGASVHMNKAGGKSDATMSGIPNE